MSIYASDKKARLCKGDYRPAQFYKGSTKIAGWNSVAQQGVKLDFEGTYNDSLDFKIYGKSEQDVTVQGKNLYLVTKSTYAYKATSNIINSTIEVVSMETGRSGYILTDYIKLEVGKKYTHSYKFDGFSSAATPSVLWFRGAGEVVSKTENFAPTVTDNYRLGFYHNNSQPFEVGEKVKYYDIQIEESSSATSYEPFVPDSPSSDYPQEIYSSENFDIVRMGNNAFDISKLPTRDSVSISDKIVITKTDLLKWSYYYVFGALLPNTAYTLTFKVDGVFTGRIYRFLGAVIWGKDIIKNTYVGQFITDKNGYISSSEGNNNIEMYQNYPSSTIAMDLVTDQVTLHDIQLLQGAYTAAAIPLYQPYKSTTVHITNQLRAIQVDTNSTHYCYTDSEGNKWASDSIEVKNGEVFENRRIDSTLLDNTKRIDNQNQALLPVAIRTDITTTPLGQALLAMKTVPHYTHIYTNAEVQPWLSAEVKVINN